MKYTLQEGQSFDAEILRQELIPVLGDQVIDGEQSWWINTAGNSVELLRNEQAWSEVGFAGSPPQDTFWQVAEQTILAHFTNGPKRESNRAILKQIAELEATQTPRRVREGGEWLKALDAQIAALRSQLQ